ncbi:MAG TPA: hypothetical protein VKM35_13485 [Arenimonas sp.]|uniref:hypothetical protein n=1 Tax=Arenimonas sp. TaxID=1872635 RepID=UPI002B60F759|nr:hypothetical protein [Arenimonas sp.]HMB58205.1 hypothetical protein [Arenimonas sp.]
MPFLALILFAPWFAILGWVYWTYPKSHAVTPARRRLDVLALLIALVLSAFAMRWAFFQPFDGVGKMWPQVIATLAGYHVFLLVLAVAFFIRRKKYRSV